MAKSHSDISAATADKDNHLVFKEMLAALFDADPAKGIEIMSAGGKNYLRGPMPMFGIPDDN